MPTLPTHADFRQAGITEAVGSPTRLSREILEADGSEVANAINVGATMGEEAAVFAQRSINESRLATVASEGDDALEQWGASNYGETREGPLTALATLVWRRDPSATSITLERGTVVTATTGEVFELDDDLVMTGAGPAEVLAVAVVAGLSGNVAENTITQPQADLPDPTLTVSNPERAAGGTDGESPDEYQARLARFFPAARKGTRAAIEDGVLSTPGVGGGSVFEVLDDDGQPTGYGQAVISGAGGTQANTALARRVVERLEDFRGLGIPIEVIAGQPTLVTIVVNGLGFATSVSNTSKLLSQVARAIVAKVNRLQPGKPLRQSLIVGVLESFDELDVPEGAVQEPAGDLLPVNNLEVIRTSLSLVLLNQP